MKISLLFSVCSTKITSAVTFGKLSLLRSLRRLSVGADITGRDWEESRRITLIGLVGRLLPGRLSRYFFDTFGWCG